MGYILCGRRGAGALDLDTSELVTIFSTMPADMRAGLLDFARSMGRYIRREGLDGGEPSAKQTSTVHDPGTGFRGEPESH